MAFLSLLKIYYSDTFPIHQIYLTSHHPRPVHKRTSTFLFHLPGPIPMTNDFQTQHRHPADSSKPKHHLPNSVTKHVSNNLAVKAQTPSTLASSRYP